MPFDDAFFGDLIRAHYAVDIQAIQPFPSSSIHAVRAVCRVILADGSSWTLRAGKSDAPIPDWLVGCGANTTPELLASRAATLQYLEEHGYSAPRMISTRSGHTIGQHNGWYTFATTFIAGLVTDPTPPNLRGMAAALGRLHHLPLHSPSSSTQPGQSWWFPELAIPAVLEQYAMLRPNLPSHWNATVDAFCATIRSIYDRDLPRAIIHGDGWAANAVQTADQQMVLIDWDPSGQGIAILDLGRLLVHAHQTLAAPLAIPTTLSAALIEAVIDGYCQARIPTPAEREALLDAIRFGIAFGAASHFSAAQRAGWPEPSPAKLIRRQHWYQLSEAIAEIASQRLNQIL